MVRGSPYKQVQLVIREAPRSSRFKTVTDAWRRRLVAEHNCYLLCEAGAFVAADADMKSVWSQTKQRSGIRSIKVSAAIDSTINAGELNTENRRVFEHRQGVNATLLAHERRLRQKDASAPQLPAGVKKGAPA